MNISKKNVVAGALIALGLLLMLGAVGESDMYDEMGVYLPIWVTFGKTVVGMVMLAVGMVVGRKDND